MMFFYLSAELLPADQNKGSPFSQHADSMQVLLFKLYT